MPLMGSISQHSLHEVGFEFRDRRVTGASLFPFFDREGKTHALMFTSPEDDRIALINFERHYVSGRRWFQRLRPQRIGLRNADLSDSTAADSERLARLWHFDPWWELAADRYSAHPAVPALKSTNIPGFDERISRVWFDRTLAHVTKVGFGEGESLRVKRFIPDMLSTAARQRDRR